MVAGIGSTTGYLTEEDVRSVMAKALAQIDVAGKRLLIIIPDSTRTAPIPMFFRLFHDALIANGAHGRRASKLDYLIALGTHPPMSEEAINRLVGVTPEERVGRYAGVRVFNHCWDEPEALTTIGAISAAEIGELSGGLMAEEVPVTLNKLIFDYDLLIVCGPTFPHEVVGFSGGNKYFFPGISGAEVINFTHWLGAVITSYEVIGTRYTPVRAVIDRAATMIPTPRFCFSMVVGEKGLSGLYAGSPEEAYQAAVDLSSELHIQWVDAPYKQVLSVMPHLYDDIWTGAKGMYKMEPAIADGGEVIIYAPHITEISYVHGKVLDQIGYHCRDYFLKQMDRFAWVPRGVLAHSTHLRGMGTYDAATGEEKLRITVTLATGIPRERVEALNLKYMDPASIDPESFANREDEGVLLVRKAGEKLFRVRDGSSAA